MGILTREQCGVYQIVNTVNGHRYIGSSANIHTRWRSHRNRLRRGSHHSRHLQHAWDLYGEARFAFSVIEQCSQSSLILREQFYISTLRPEYNILPRAGTTLGRIVTDEARKKLSEALKGRAIPEEQKRRTSATLKGRRRAQSTRDKISKTLKGRNISDEWRQKISNALKGLTLSEETRRKQSIAHKGRIVSDETRRKLSEKGKAAWSKGGKRRDEEADK